MACIVKLFNISWIVQCQWQLQKVIKIIWIPQRPLIYKRQTIFFKFIRRPHLPLKSDTFLLISTASESEELNTTL